jgi:hypothetical protein
MDALILLGMATITPFMSTWVAQLFDFPQRAILAAVNRD